MQYADYSILNQSEKDKSFQESDSEFFNSNDNFELTNYGGPINKQTASNYVQNLYSAPIISTDYIFRSPQESFSGNFNINSNSSSLKSNLNMKFNANSDQKNNKQNSPDKSPSPILRGTPREKVIWI